MITLLGSRYQVVREIGAGGMGRVFQAVDTQTGRSVAAKVMLASDEENLSALLRFYQEGAVLSTLKHPNIVEVYGTFLEEGVCSIIMELLEGRSLSQLLRSEPLSLRRIKRLALQVASALQYAHSRAIVHRDIKPGNIMVVGDDRVKVTDFGIARVLEGGTLNTATGMTIGTPLYMSPEQIESQPIDGRSDIYSFGAVLYQMVAGRPPFEGRDPLSVAFKHVHKAPAPPSELNPNVPGDWEAVILRMLAKDPANRFQTVAQLEAAISGLSESAIGLPVQEAPPEPALTDRIVAMDPQAAVQPQPIPQKVMPAKAETQRGRNTRWWLLGINAGLALLIVIALLVYNLRSSSSSAKPRAAVPAKFLGQFTGFSDPEGVTVDGAGDVYVADRNNNRIEKLAASGKMLGTWGTKGSGIGQFNGPTGVALDAQGNMYVADSGNNRIQKLSASGQWLASWGGPEAGSGTGQFNGVHSVAVDAKGNVDAADFSNNRIVKLSPAGKVAGTFGELGPSSDMGKFDEPVGVAVDAQGNVYVADFNNNRVQELSASGKFVRQFTQFGNGTGFGRPHGVAVDANGNIYVADYQNNAIDELSPTGTLLHVLGSAGSGHGHFIRPAALWVDGAGNVYVADSRNNRIEKFSPMG